MASYTTSTDIPAEPRAVFEALTDFARVAEWQTIHEGFTGGAPSELGEGDSFRQQVKIMGMPAEVAWTVRRLEPPSTLELEGAGPMGVTLRTLFAVEAWNGGARLTVSNELGGGVLAGPVGESVAAGSRTEQELSLEKLKALLA